jgi:hypothetical protein
VNNRTFKIATSVLVMMMLFFLAKIGNSPEAQAERAQQTKIDSSNNTAAVDRLAEQALNKIARISFRATRVCHLHRPLCEETGKQYAYWVKMIDEAKRHRNSELLLTGYLHTINAMENEIEPNLRKMEILDATLRK